MKCRISFFLTVGLVALFLASCATVPDKYPDCKNVVVVVTADQKFVIGDKKVTASEFVDNADFNRDSSLVVLVVAKSSKVEKATMKELIKSFNDKGYDVKMDSTSKYSDLVAKDCQI